MHLNDQGNKDYILKYYQWKHLCMKYENLFLNMLYIYVDLLCYLRSFTLVSNSV